MENERFKPKLDKLYFMILIPTLLLLLSVTVIGAFAPMSFFVIIPVDLFTLYFLVSPLFGYVELRRDTMFIKFGFFLTREIPYSQIRELTKEKRIYTESMLSLKSSLLHVNVKYNKYDVVSVSVVDLDVMIDEIIRRRTVAT